MPLTFLLGLVRRHVSDHIQALSKCPPNQLKQSHIINNLLTSSVRSLWENLKPQPCHIDLAIAQSIWQGLDLRFPRNVLTLG